MCSIELQVTRPSAKPIRNMRWPVEVIIDMLGSGMTIEEIIEDHPELVREDILACLQYAKLFLSSYSIAHDVG